MHSEARRLLGQLRARGVQVRLHGDDLRVRAPRGVLDQALQQRLRGLKPALRQVLRDEARRAPLTGAQRQLWFGEQRNPGSHAHHLVIDAHLEGLVDVAALRGALEQLVARHDALRTRFTAHEGVPEQVVGPAFTLDLDPALGEGLDPTTGPVFVARLHALGRDRHRLRLRIHHLVIDGGSLSVLLDELGALMRGQVLPPVRHSPLALARSMQAHEAAPDFDARLDPWVDRLGGVRPVMLPSDRPRRAQPSDRGGRVCRTLDVETWAAVGRLARAHGATAFTVLAAALGLVLSRWTDDTTPCLGIPHAGRTLAEHEGVVGMFVDTTLLALDLGGDPSFSTLVARTRDGWLACLEHADLPLDRVIARRRTRGHGEPLPDVTLNFIPFGDLRLSLPGVEAQLTGHMPGSRFDLTVYAYPREDTLDVELAYRAESFHEARMVALWEQLRHVLVQATAQPEHRVSMVALSPIDAVPVRARPEWSAARQPDLLAQVEAVQTTRAAVVGVGTTLDYGRLCARAKSVTATLQHEGLGPGDRIAIIGRRESDLLVALLGVWGAGCTMMIVDASHPVARLSEQLALADPRGWIAIGATGPRLPNLADCIEIAIAHDTDGHEAVEWSRPPPEAPAYIAFTSGTTGTPQAVEAGFAPLVHGLAWYHATFETAPDDRFALLSGLGHDPALRDMLAAVTRGASVHIPPDDPIRMGPGLASWIDAERITTLHLTPSLARVIAAAAVGPLRAVRRVIFGGAPLRGTDVARWQALCPDAALFNAYGTTETPQIVCCRAITKDDARAQTVPIGVPIDGVGIALHTAKGGPVGLGEVGEIVVHSEYLARQWRGAARTDGGLGGSCYRTGDRGRWRLDGAVDFVGRADRQLEIRGQRIEAEDVEHALLAAPGVTQAAVAARPDPHDADERELVGAVVGPPLTDAASVDAIRRAMLQRLPAAMVPSRLTIVAALPLTSRGKTDTDAVAALSFEHDTTAEPSGGPRHGLQRAVAAIWAELLHCGDVGLHDDFFACGGHSLRAVELAARIQAQLGRPVPVAMIFEHPTLGDLAQALARPAVDAAPLRSLPPDVVPQASVTQQRLWLLDTLDDGAPQLRIDHALQCITPLDAQALDRALVDLERRHEPLRTVLVLEGSTLVQRVQAGRTTIVEGQPPDRVELDLGRGPVWRAFVWTAGVDDHRLRLVIHHAAGDAAAMEVLTGDLVALYQAHVAGKPADLPPLTHRYAEIAAWQHDHLTGPGQQALLEAWRQRLSNAPPLMLPLARARPHRQGYRGARVDRTLDPPAVEAIERCARTAGATPFMVLLTALGAVLARWGGTDDLTIGTPVGMRPHPAAAAVVGPFLNLVAIRIDAAGDPPLDALLARVRGRALEAFARATLPLTQVLQTVKPDRALDRTPLFSVLFNMIDADATDRAWAQLGARRTAPHEVVARYDLAVYAVRRSTGMTLSVVYDRDLFDPG
ncbi:MAG: AMP-binding protein, partial [Deltaproteobacteria bacterium]|nr:AMP-binding protein [Deltaproteobacteria bacterium]